MATEANANALKSGYQWPNGTSTLYFQFWSSVPSYYAPGDTERSGFQAFTPLMKDAARDILADVSNFTNLSFIETSTVSQAQIGFGQANLPAGYEAWAYYPATVNGDSSGDVWVDTSTAGGNYTPGSYGYYILLHEIGHALGLKHSFESPALPSAEDNTYYTVMTYNDTVNPLTYMLYDMKALQDLYGANMTYRTGDDTYTAPASGTAYTIWDAGGTDTISAGSISASVTIDLRQGGFSSVGATDNIIIAYGVTIENTAGGSGSDIFYDNDAANQLSGGGGDDRFYLYGKGNDAVNGGSGTDTAYFNYSFASFVITYVSSYTFTLQNTLANGSGTDTLSEFEIYSFNGATYSHAQLVTLFGPPPGVTLRGTQYDDTLTGGDGDDSITDGNQGNGIPEGGNDIFSGGKGRDAINGGLGDDTLYGGDGDDRLYGGEGNDYIDGGEGNDEIRGMAGNDTLLGGGGDDYIIGDGGFDYFDGGDGNDTLIGSGDDATMNGGAGNDYFSIVGGDNIINGGDGNDNVSISFGGSNTIHGDAGNDTLRGSSGTDMIWGDDGDDWLSESTGVNTLDGGDGTDTAWFGVQLNWDNYLITIVDADTVVVENLTDEPGVNTLVSIETFTFYNNDVYTRLQLEAFVAAGPPVYPDLVVDGTAKKDTLSGGRGNDTLNGLAGNDILVDGNGNDTLNGGDGDDILIGANGNDTLNGDKGNDKATGGIGADVLNGGDGNDSLAGATGNDILSGDAGNDTLDGEDGADTINGGLGADKIDGGAGNDTLNGNEDRDTVNGAGGDDILDGGAGDDKLDGGLGNDTLAGGEGKDFLNGNDGNDTLIGGAGNDTLTGGLGDDILSAGPGVDKLTGGDGADSFVFDTVPAAGNSDTITDFTAGDKVDISALLAAYDPLADMLSDFVDVSVKGKNTIVKIDMDGALNGQSFVTVATLQKIVFANESDMVTAGALLVS